LASGTATGVNGIEADAADGPPDGADFATAKVGFLDHNAHTRGVFPSG
jgi:hypothetical protein